MRLVCFPVVALLPCLMRGRFAGRRGDGKGSHPLLCSLGNRPVCVCLLQLKCHEAAGPLIQHLCHHNMCHYLGAGHHFTSHLLEKEM